MCEIYHEIIYTENPQNSAQYTQADNGAQIAAADDGVESVPFVLAGFSAWAQSRS